MNFPEYIKDKILTILKLDLDNLRYEQTCSNRRYSTYVREAKKRGEVFLDREEWAMSLEEERSNDINSIQLQQTEGYDCTPGWDSGLHF